MGQEFYKKIYTVKEGYVALIKGLRTVKYFVKSKKSGQMSPHFIERIMITVTEVNGCEVCSYGHTKIALEQGMSDEEIQMLFSGYTEAIPNDEMKAILFAQHYADTRGNPTKDSWNRILEGYGIEKALGILGAIRMIMIGNSYGIAYSALKRRLKGKPIKKSNLLYEIKMLSSLIVFPPIALIHSLILKLLKVPITDFD